MNATQVTASVKAYASGERRGSREHNSANVATTTIIRTRPGRISQPRYPLLDLAAR